MTKLSSYKSLKPHASSQSVFDVLSSLSRERSPFQSAMPHTKMASTEDGRVQVSKQSPSFGVTRDLPNTDEMKALASSISLPWKEAYEGRAIPVFSSDERVDRAGDIVLQNFDLASYEKNPLVLFSHDWDGLPIGVSLRNQVTTREDDQFKGPALEQILLFASEEDSAFSDSVFRLMKSAILRTVSIGFFPKTVIQVEDEEERNEIGLGRFGVIFDDNELVEVSPTSVPANPGALLTGVKAASDVLRPEDALVAREIARNEVVRGTGDSHRWRSIDASIRRAFEACFEGTHFKAHPDLDEPIFIEGPGDDSVLEKMENELKESKRVQEELQNRLEKVEEELDIKAAAYDSSESESASESRIYDSIFSDTDEILRGLI